MVVLLMISRTANDSRSRFFNGQKTMEIFGFNEKDDDRQMTDT